MGAAADYDVVIIGAGPGGLAAANALLVGDSSLRIKVAAMVLLPAGLTLTSLSWPLAQLLTCAYRVQVFERASSLRPAGFVVVRPH